jgi:formylglycine-generating enzyme required for sulfatase activity
MKSLILTGSLLALTAASLYADTFGSGDNAFTIDFVNIGNAGNGNDAGAGGGLYFDLLGGVPYRYRMGVTEVPQEWITKATNLGMTNVTAGPATWTALQPAANMTWYEAAAFVNFLNTSMGHHVAYDLMQIPPDGQGNTWSMKVWESAQAWQAGGENLYRHKDAYYFLPSEDEWYKAAYHQNDGVTANYWDYATGSNSIPTAVASGTTAGTAVFNLRGGGTMPAAVNNAGGLSAYGTMGQSGNVYEWNESADLAPNDVSSENRESRGGKWSDDEENLRSSWSYPSTPGDEILFKGFRVASVPEPSAAVLMLGAGLMLFARRRRESSF